VVGNIGSCFVDSRAQSESSAVASMQDPLICEAIGHPVPDHRARLPLSLLKVPADHSRFWTEMSTAAPLYCGQVPDLADSLGEAIEPCQGDDAMVLHAAAAQFGPCFLPTAATMLTMDFRSNPASAICSATDLLVACQSLTVLKRPPQDQRTVSAVPIGRMG